MTFAISDNDYHSLQNFHALHWEKVKIGSACSSAAAFLLIGALIVIGCSSLCIMLPGVNVITQIVFPAIIPSSFAIVFSIPLILIAVKSAEDATFIREEMVMDMMMKYLNKYDVALLKGSMRRDFILRNFFAWPLDPHDDQKVVRNINWTRDYQQKIAMDFKKKIGEKEDDRHHKQEKISRAFDQALGKVNKRK
jgi:hypothetical protein